MKILEEILPKHMGRRLADYHVEPKRLIKISSYSRF
jgi:hypothetical protein